MLQISHQMVPGYKGIPLILILPLNYIIIIIKSIACITLFFSHNFLSLVGTIVFQNGFWWEMHKKKYL